MGENTESNELYDIVCKNRVYQCLGCDFVGSEQSALDHQVECDNPMELLE